MKKPLLLLIGLIATGLAIVGIWTPGLPTTPFLIVALWAFASSSERLHKWLSQAPLFKHAMVHVREFQENKAVKKEVKIISQLCAWGSFLIILALNGLQNLATALVLIAAILCSMAMYRLKTSE